MRTQGIGRTMARRRGRWPVLALVCWMAACSCRGGGGCSRVPDAAATAAGRLALFPVDTRVVVSFDFAALRANPAAGKLATLAERSQADANEIAEFTSRTGLDPLKQIDGLTAAFPEEGRRRGELGLVLRAARFD